MLCLGVHVLYKGFGARQLGSDASIQVLLVFQRFLSIELLFSNEAQFFLEAAHDGVSVQLVLALVSVEEALLLFEVLVLLEVLDLALGAGDSSGHCFCLLHFLLALAARDGLNCYDLVYLEDVGRVEGGGGGLVLEIDEVVFGDLLGGGAVEGLAPVALAGESGVGVAQELVLVLEGPFLVLPVWDVKRRFLVSILTLNPALLPMGILRPHGHPVLTGTRVGYPKDRVHHLPIRLVLEHVSVVALELRLLPLVAEVRGVQVLHEVEALLLHFAQPQFRVLRFNSYICLDLEVVTHYLPFLWR